jgi:holliday junction DNA helicase RuvA
LPRACREALSESSEACLNLFYPTVIAHISGTLAQKIPGEAIVDVGGVGYQIFIPLNVFYRLPEIGASVSLQIYTHVREDALQLFGFQDPAEKQLFLLLLSVSGIGPKLAVNILSGIAADELSRALKDADQVRLVAIPGVGKKLAERMIVELKDKFATFTPAGPESSKTDGGSQLLLDAVSALVNLGYKRPDAEKMVREVLKRGERSLENLLKETLRRMSP